MQPSVNSVERVPLLAPYEGDNIRERTRELTRARLNQDLESLSNRASSFVYKLLSCVTCCGETVEVRQGYDVILTRWGIITEVLRQPNVYLRNSSGLETKEMWAGGYQSKLTSLKANDANGIPMFVSALYGWQIVDAITANNSTENLTTFMEDQAKSVLLEVVSQYPYDDHRPRRGICLRYVSQEVYAQLKNTLQKYVRDIGIQINYFTISGIGVEENSQKFMLAKQEAQAYVDGRRKIAQGAIGIVEKDIESLRKHQVNLSEAESKALATDLLYMMSNHGEMSLRFYQRNPDALPQMVLPSEQTS